MAGQGIKDRAGEQGGEATLCEGTSSLPHLRLSRPVDLATCVGACAYMRACACVRARAHCLQCLNGCMRKNKAVEAIRSGGGRLCKKAEAKEQAWLG